MSKNVINEIKMQTKSLIYRKCSKSTIKDKHSKKKKKKPDVKSFMGYNNLSGIIGVGPVIVGKARWSLMSKAPIGRAEAMAH